MVSVESVTADTCVFLRAGFIKLVNFAVKAGPPLSSVPSAYNPYSAGYCSSASTSPKGILNIDSVITTELRSPIHLFFPLWGSEGAQL